MQQAFREEPSVLSTHSSEFWSTVAKGRISPISPSLLPNYFIEGQRKNLKELMTEITEVSQ